MLGFEHYRDTERLYLFHDRMRDLGRQTFLHLQPAGINLYHPGDLGQTDDMAVGQVGDLGLADKRQEVMLAERKEIEVSAQDHLLVVLFGEEGTVDRVLGILVVTAGQELEGLNDTDRSTRQALAFRIFADMAKNGTYGFFCRLPALSHYSILC